MGISGLLPLLKKATTKSHVRKLSGCTVGIDGYVWLHKGAFGCAVKLGMGEPTTAYVTYCLKYINVLLAHNVRPIVVLDGRNLPSKSETEKKRREKRKENREAAREFMRQGDKSRAWECFTKCVDVTPAMARELIKVLREMKIDYIIAPYEADAQLAYLARKKIIDVVITEDSDLVLFGCPKIFFKMSVEGDGMLFDETKLYVAMGLKSGETFRFERFRWMCILSGCDYLASLPGIGLGRAKKLVDSTSSDDIRKILSGVAGLLKSNIEVTKEYIEGFLQAENTFLYQLVFDPTTRKLQPLTPYLPDVTPEDVPYAGSYDREEFAVDLALGNVDIHTLQQVDDFEPMRSGYDKSSMWSASYKPDESRKILTARDLKKSASIGMQMNVPATTTTMRKRPLPKQDSEDNDSLGNDEELRCMYKTETTAEISASATQVFEDQANKRQRMHEDSDDDEELRSPSTPSSSKRNPFLKFANVKKTGCSAVLSDKRGESEISVEKVEKIEINNVLEDGGDNITTTSTEHTTQVRLTRLSSSRMDTVNKMQEKTETEEFKEIKKIDIVDEHFPVCLVEKNRVYDDVDGKVVVKSRYFKNNDDEKLSIEKQPLIVKTSPLKLPPSTHQITRTSSKLSIYSLKTEETESEQTVSAQNNGPNKEPLSDSDEDDGVNGEEEVSSFFSKRIYEDKIRNDSNNLFEEITIEDDEASASPRNKLKWKVRGPSDTEPVSTQTLSQSRASSCKKVGLSKFRNGKNKPDPKQRSILSMMMPIVQKLKTT